MRLIHPALILLTSFIVNSLHTVQADNLISPDSANTKLIASHDVIADEDGYYLLGDNDPYFIFELENKSDESKRKKNAKGLQLSIDKPINKNIQLEIFFKHVNPKVGDSNSIPAFEPLSFIKASVPAAQDGLINIDLPSPIIANISSVIRIDVNGCSKCRMRINSTPKLVTAFKPNAKFITINELLNGGQRVGQNGFELSFDNWQSNDLNVTTTRSTIELEIIGEDPHLVSPLINLRTQNLGGVLFTLTPPPGLREATDFQLFYETETHGFVQSESTHWRNDYTASATNTAVDMLIPLDHLSTQQPIQNVIKRIRFDINDIEETETAKNWSLNEVRFISMHQLADLRSVVPTRRSVIKTQRPSVKQLLISSIKKVSHDLSFTIFYLLLLLLTAFGFWRAFKR